MLFVNQVIKRQFYKGIRGKWQLNGHYTIYLFIYFFFWGGGGGQQTWDINITVLYPNLYYNEVWYKGTVLYNIQSMTECTNFFQNTLTSFENPDQLASTEASWSGTTVYIKDMARTIYHGPMPVQVIEVLL